MHFWSGQSVGDIIVVLAQSIHSFNETAPVKYLTHVPIDLDSVIIELKWILNADDRASAAWKRWKPIQIFGVVMYIIAVWLIFIEFVIRLPQSGAPQTYRIMSANGTLFL